MIQKQNQNVPKLRFPGFEGAWEQASLSEKVTSIKSGRTKQVEAGKYPVYGSTGLLGFTDKAEFRGQSLLIARVGANAGQLNRADGQYGVTDNTLVVIPSSIIDLGFLEASLRRFNLNRLVFGSGQPLVTGTMLKRLKREFPTLPEQRKIAGFLDELNGKISQLGKKKALLKDYKIGCVQQLFSQKIRFKDDDENDFPSWERKRVGDIFKLVTTSIMPNQYDEMFAYYSLPAFDEFGASIETHGSAIDSNKFQVLEEMLLVSKLNPRKPRVMRTSCSDLRSCCSTEFMVYAKRPPETAVLDYFFHLFNGPEFVKKLVRSATGSTNSHVRVTPTETLNWVTPYPHPAEQRKIADFLSALDHKIELVAKELTHARSFKAGLLQQMFV
jgi:type I restriction enzyme S subunit